MRLKKVHDRLISYYNGGKSTDVASFYISEGILDVEFNPELVRIQKTDENIMKSQQVLSFVKNMGVNIDLLTHQKLATIFLNQDGITLHGVGQDDFLEMLTDEEKPQIGLMMMDIVEPFICREITSGGSLLRDFK